MFSKVLIANRGAIAVRIERTLQRLGIKSVAVYAEDDKDSLHVDRADEAICLGDGSVQETYLDEEKILAAAQKTGAEAIHPGYGFLSESPQFARACKEAGVVFIGPDPDQMEQFSLKHVARKLAQAAGVPELPGTGLLQTRKEALLEAERVGFPVMLKSTAGGGGIGMRVCSTPAQLSEAFDSVVHLAQTNFGDAGVFLEKYVTHARHVEVQIFGSDGKALAIGDRDCSVQRRNQKVVEECPAPGIPDEVRTRLHACAQKLAESVEYRNAGTVEFLYDEDNAAFYFLEVNTRLQVEHGVTEECFDIDLVEWQLREAAGEMLNLDWITLHQKGCAIECRLYAEDPLRDFAPATGKIDEVVFDKRARIETWIRKGITVTSHYDPMLAKIIVHADTRSAACSLMSSVLDHTKVYGVTTNVRYLCALFSKPEYQQGKLSTKILNGFAPQEATVEVVDGGIQTTVQDWPGMMGHWDVGVPPLGPMDALSFRLGNALLGNDAHASGLECTVRGGSYKFRCDSAVCITGADMHPTLDGKPLSMWSVHRVRAGQTLSLGMAQTGMRSYILIAGGFDMPLIFNSASTFIDGGFGGHGGRCLRVGDVLNLKDVKAYTNTYEGLCMPAALQAPIESSWTVGVLAGPMCTKEFLLSDCLVHLTQSSYTVAYDSARTGVRLNGPAPLWARTDGGEAGLHPSNVHDTPYSFGALDLTGDQPILLGPDGPSLGGFVCPVVTAMSQRWKLGQLKPGDEVHFQVLSPTQADALRVEQENIIQWIAHIASQQGHDALQDVQRALDLLASDHEHPYALPHPVQVDPQSAILYEAGQGEEAICIRRSGEDALMVEYGPRELHITLRFRIHVLMRALLDSELPVIDITPGIRSLQVHFDPSVVSAEKVLSTIVKADADLPDLQNVTVPSRIVHLPLSWDDPQAQLAARRYQETTRPDAPWCPSNPEFIRRINGLDSINDVYDIVFNATYLVLGLGDVYLGAPVATPIDPRQRLVTTKYNPARPWTPENAVGIGGVYLCVYGMEGPGGYQLVGRTTQMWNPVQVTDTFTEGKPWLLDFFDQIKFYPVTADELLSMREDNLRGRFNVRIEKTTFSLADYRAFVDDHAKSIAEFKAKREAAFNAEYQRWVEQGLDTFVSEEPEAHTFAEVQIPDGCLPVSASLSGGVWKVNVSVGQRVSKGEAIVVLESMKMEFPAEAPIDGLVESVAVHPGDVIEAGQVLVVLRPC